MRLDWAFQMFTVSGASAWQRLVEGMHRASLQVPKQTHRPDTRIHLLRLFLRLVARANPQPLNSWFWHNDFDSCRKRLACIGGSALVQPPLTARAHCAYFICRCLGKLLASTLREDQSWGLALNNKPPWNWTDPLKFVQLLWAVQSRGDSIYISLSSRYGLLENFMIVEMHSIVS